MVCKAHIDSCIGARQYRTGPVSMRAVQRLCMRMYVEHAPHRGHHQSPCVLLRTTLLSSAPADTRGSVRYAVIRCRRCHRCTALNSSIATAAITIAARGCPITCQVARHVSQRRSHLTLIEGICMQNPQAVIAGAGACASTCRCRWRAMAIPGWSTPQQIMCVELSGGGGGAP